MKRIFKHIDEELIAEFDPSAGTIFANIYSTKDKTNHSESLGDVVGLVSIFTIENTYPQWQEQTPVKFMSFDGYPIHVGDMVHTVGKMNLSSDYIQCTDATTNKSETTLFFLKEENAIEYIELYEKKYSAQEVLFAMLWAIEDAESMNVNDIFKKYIEHKSEYKKSAISLNGNNEHFLLSFKTNMNQ